jgi:hypothetical protein
MKALAQPLAQLRRAALSSFILTALLITLDVMSALGRTLLSSVVSSVFLLARLFLPAGLVGLAGLATGLVSLLLLFLVGIFGHETSCF